MVRLIPFRPRPDVTGEQSQDPHRALVTKATRGDKAAQRTLLISLGPQMLKVVRGVLGTSDSDEDDALQEANLALLRALSTFRGECTVVHFACQVALRSTMNLRRRRSYRARHTPLVGPSELHRYAHTCEGAAESIATRRCLEALRHLLVDLPEPLSEVIAMRIFLGFTVAEAAEAMRLPVGTVKRRLTSALSLLRARGLQDTALLELIEGHHGSQTQQGSAERRQSV